MVFRADARRWGAGTRKCRLSQCRWHRAAHDKGEIIWRSKQRIRFAFGTMATLRRRRDFTPRPFPIHPLTRCTSRRETFRPGTASLYEQFREHHLNGLGQVRRFMVRLRDFRNGVWAGEPIAVAVVALTGEVAPGTGGATFGGLHPLSSGISATATKDKAHSLQVCRGRA